MNKFFNSKTTAIFLALMFIVLHYYIRGYVYDSWSKIVGWDVLSYYIYLPFNFIYHDSGITNQELVKQLLEKYQLSGTFYQAFPIENGNWIPMYTIGFAILFAPFFFLAHVWVSIFGGYPPDGFSFPYQFIIGNGVMIYIVAGIFLIRKVLLRYFSDAVTSVVMILMLLGTNYFHEASSDECMPHAILFTAYALILYLTAKWHDEPKRVTAGWLGFVLGFMILARGSEIVALLIPLIWNIYDKASIKAKWELIINNYKHIVLAIACFLIVPAIQMLQWKYVTGSFIFHSYQNTEGFDWDGQHILKVLFSYKKSWFLYTPMIVLAILGIGTMWRISKTLFWTILIFFLANFYLISSWAAWWQGGSFGMRYFVESYAVMCLPMGYLLVWLHRQRFWFKIIITVIASFFLFLNLFQTWQFNHWIIDGYAMTKEYYWRVFLKTKVTDDDKKLREIIREFGYEDTLTNPQDYNKHTISFNDFDKINSVPVSPEFIDTVIYLTPPNSCKLTKERVYSPTLQIPYRLITKKEHAWIRVNLDYYPVHDFKDNPANISIYLEHNHRFVNKYKGWGLDKQPYKLKQWNHIQVDYLIPYPLSNDDILKVFVYLQGDKELYIDNMHIETFERKW